MIKCKCTICGEEETYPNHKLAWMEGWSFTTDTRGNDMIQCHVCVDKPKKSALVELGDDEH
jgi:hypothetical protein